MNRLQVRDLLGVPLLADPFHADRWDYIFTYKQPSKPLVRREVVLRFDGDALKSIEAPELPSEREFVGSIARNTGSFNASLLELSPEQMRALPVPPKPAASAPEAPPSVSGRSYPPLEPS
jgi:outer membrane protein assembly factor BamE